MTGAELPTRRDVRTGVPGETLPQRHASARWSGGAALAALIAVAVLAGCASPPRPAGGAAPAPPPRPAARPPAPPFERDGLEANPPPIDLTQVPDAQPQVEPIRPGGPNKPYVTGGQTYTPIAEDRAYSETGLASWYGRKFHGRRTASGELYNMYTMTAAHPTLPIPSYARVRNPSNGREVVVRVNDRGPFVKGRIIDLSYAAAVRLEVQNGVAPVEVQRITFEEIRTGAWRRDGSTAVAAAVPPSAPPQTAAPATLAAPVPAPAEVLAPVVAMPADQAVPAPASESPAAPPAAVASAAAPGAASAPGVADAPPARAFTTPARGFWVQLGAFRAHDGAVTFQKRVAAEADWIAPLLAVFGDAALFKLQAGPYPGRDEARAVAERIRAALQLVPVIVERR